MIQSVQAIVQSKFFQNFILFLIILAAVIVGIETDRNIDPASLEILHILDDLILYLFTLEAALKILAEGKKPWRYFQSGWNLFDFAIVAVCYLPATGSFVTVLRLFRLFRAIRLISVIPKLQILVGALLKSIPSMFYISILLSLFFYIYAVMGVMLFGDNDPLHFGDLGISLLTLFRVVTLEDWTDVMYLQMYGSDIYQGFNQSIEGMDIVPKAQPVVGILYFVSFVLFGTMIMLNLVIGVIINSMDEAHKEVDRASKENAETIQEVKAKLKEISDKLDTL